MSGSSRSGTGRTGGRRPFLRTVRRRVAKALFGFDPEDFERLAGRVDHGERRLDTVEQRTSAAERRLDAVESGVGAAEQRLDAAEGHARELVAELESVRDRRVPTVEERLDRLESDLRRLVAETAHLRDERLPAAVARGDVLVERLARELEEVASLVERVLAREPLPVPDVAPEVEESVDLAGLAPHLLAELRGPEGEIRHRLERYLPLLSGHEPVLDLGCGRGELLGLLAESGIEASGIEADPALAAACRRRGLPVEEADALAALAERHDASLGAVTAVHLLEHLPPAAVARLLAEARRVLRPGGVCLVEVPNPETLRVGAGDFWLDPTHVRPFPAGAIEVLAHAAGLRVVDRRPLHPYPEEQRLTARITPQLEEVPEPVRRAVGGLAAALDELLYGPRDVLLVLERPGQEEA